MLAKKSSVINGKTALAEKIYMSTWRTRFAIAPLAPVSLGGLIRRIVDPAGEFVSGYANATDKDAYKRGRPVYTPCGVWPDKQRRKKENIAIYSQLVIVDWDKLTEQEVTELLFFIESIPKELPVFAYRSISGNGVHALFYVNNATLENHDETWQAVVAMCREELPCRDKIDVSASKDITKCFVPATGQCSWYACNYLSIVIGDPTNDSR